MRETIVTTTSKRPKGPLLIAIGLGATTSLGLTMYLRAIQQDKSADALVPLARTCGRGSFATLGCFVCLGTPDDPCNLRRASANGNQRPNHQVETHRAIPGLELCHARLA